ncbi:MAG: phosphoribosylamine--glycine ligase [Epulopiscium sp. Nele67-Bin001]|nr:MAG: phosphoribosylamine--glycine ligase [Epulopiscium sp. Nele67-Bin001]
MKVLIIGNGGREVAICETLYRQSEGVEIFMAPPNAGVSHMAVSVPIDILDFDSLITFAKENSIDLTIVGPEAPLVGGIVDIFQKNGFNIFGPNKECAQFEGSKRFTKEFLTRHNIPTAKYAAFSKAEREKALTRVMTFNLPIVVKADGLAAGKGVLICTTYEEAKQAIVDIFDDVFKGAGEHVVIEEFLAGIEASLMCFVDTEVIFPMETARDYKRIYDNDEGLNTGGMGSFSPNPVITPKLSSKIRAEILNPIINGFIAEDLEFVGVLFIGLMICNDEPYVLEFNVRFGDPETQSILPRLNSSLLDTMIACTQSQLSEVNLEWDDRVSTTVVLASGGYPQTATKGCVISGLENVDKDVKISHSGTALDEANNYITNGGRVLSLTALADTLDEARDKVYKEVSKINFEQMQYRTDIANI